MRKYVWTELCFTFGGPDDRRRDRRRILGMVGGLGVGVMVLFWPDAFLRHRLMLFPDYSFCCPRRPLFTFRRAGFTGQTGGKIRVATRALHYALLAPFICYIFTFMSGTGHVVYSLLPVISGSRTTWYSTGTSFIYFPLSHRNRRSPPVLYLRHGGDDWLMAPLGSISTIMMICARHVNRRSDGSNSDL